MTHQSKKEIMDDLLKMLIGFMFGFLVGGFYIFNTGMRL